LKCKLISRFKFAADMVSGSIPEFVNDMTRPAFLETELMELGVDMAYLAVGTVEGRDPFKVLMERGQSHGWVRRPDGPRKEGMGNLFGDMG
jgi:hypothetical protein